MKTELHEVTKTVTVYIADDGRVFENEEECKKYEKDMAAEKIFQSLPHFRCGKPFYCEDDNVYDWFYLKNEEELNAMRHEVFEEDNFETDDYKVKEYPCWVCAVHGYESGYGYILGTLNEAREALFGWLDNIVKEQATIEAGMTKEE